MFKKYYVCIKWDEECVKEYAEKFNGIKLPEKLEFDINTKEVDESNTEELRNYLTKQVEILFAGLNKFQIESFGEKEVE